MALWGGGMNPHSLDIYNFVFNSVSTFQKLSYLAPKTTQQDKYYSHFSQVGTEIQIAYYPRSHTAFNLLS